MAGGAVVAVSAAVAAPAAGRVSTADSAPPRPSAPLRAPHAPTMTAETHLQGVEISAAQFFEIWHHYDSDGDSFSPRGGRGAGGARGQARGRLGWDPTAPRPKAAPAPLRARRPQPRGAAPEPSGSGVGAGRGAQGAGPPGGNRRVGDVPGRAEEWSEFGGSGDRNRNSFCCRQWVHGREGATKLHPGAAAGSEEGRLGRLMFCPTFPSLLRERRVFLSKLQCPGSSCSQLPSHGSCTCFTRQREVARLEITRLLMK